MTSHAPGTTNRLDPDVSTASKSGEEERSSSGVRPVPLSVEAATLHAKEATERFNTGHGYSGQETKRLALRSRRDFEAVMQSGSVLTKALQDSTGDWLGMVQGQWKRHVDGMGRLMQAKSALEFGEIQGELARESLEHVLKDSRDMAERSMQAADEAGKSLERMTTERARDAE